LAQERNTSLATPPQFYRAVCGYAQRISFFTLLEESI